MSATRVPPNADPAYSVAVYDARTGVILHVHHFSAMPGVALPGPERLESMALALAARRHRREPASMGVLRFEASAMERKRAYRVALPDRRLVEERKRARTPARA